MDLGSLRKIDDVRMDLVSGYVDDTVRGVENGGLGEFEYEALRLVAAYERENGRAPGAGEGAGGYVMAASRLLDNAFGADDGPYEMATLMAADLALQRHAASVVGAAEEYGRSGAEPEGFDRFLVTHVIKEDLQDDPEIKADWKAMSEGRFHDASRLVEEIIRTGVRDGEHLEPSASDWMYANQAREELPSTGRRSGLVDVLEDLDGPRPYEPSHRDFQEWVAGEGDAHEWDDARHADEASRFFGSPSRGEVGRLRMEEARREGLDPSNVADEVERDAAAGASFADKSIYVGGERLRAMVEADDPRAPALAAALAHAVMGEKGAEAAESSAWLFEDRPSAGLSDMLARIDREDGDERHGLSKGTSERIAMSQARDDVRSLTADDRTVDGMVSACGLAAEERGVPLNRLIAAVAEERRRSDRTFAARSDAVNDAVKETLLESSVAEAEAARRRSALSAPAPEERPFFSRPTSARIDEAERAVGDVSDALVMSDPTIPVERGLLVAAETLNAAGLGMYRGAGVDRMEAAWGRVIEARADGVRMDHRSEAKMVVYDVATQAEAAGIASGLDRDVQEGAIGRVLVASMGIRTLREEQAGPLALKTPELAEVAAGNLAALPRGTQAGFSLGMARAREAEGLPLREPRLEQPRRGLLGQAAGAASKGFSRVDAKAPEERPAPAPASMERGR